MNYNDKNYRPPITYSRLNTMSLCKRKEVMCEYANVIGRCIYTQCVKKINNTKVNLNKTNLERWMGGDGNV